MPATPQQLSFTRGEWSPTAWYRYDLEGHDGACRLMHNCFPLQMGGAMNRPGTQFLATVKNSAQRSRLVPFIFSTQQAYILEFGNKYVRFYYNVAGVVGQVIVTPTAYAGGTTYSYGMTCVSGGNYYVYINPVASSGNTPPNTTYWYPLTAYGTGTAIYEIPTPYAYSDLPLIKWDQSADTLYIVHPSYPPATLTRSYTGGSTQWTYAPIAFGSTVASPTGVTVTNGTGTASPILSLTSQGSGSWPSYGGFVAVSGQFSVTAVVAGAESPISNSIYCLPGAVISWTSVPSATQYNLYYQGNDSLLGSFTSYGWWRGMTNVSTGMTLSSSSVVNGLDISASITAGTAFCVTSIDSNNHESLPSNIVYGSQVTGTVGNTVSWTASTQAASYNIYCQYNGIWGFVASALQGQTSYVFPGGTYVNNIAITPNTGKGIPLSNNPFGTATNYPSTVAFYQNRLWFAATSNQPQTFWASRTGDYTNFNTSSFTVDSDSFNFTINSRRLNQIKAMIPTTLALLMHTSGGVWAVSGSGGIGSFSAVTPTSIQVSQQDYLYGSNDNKPISVGINALYPDHSGGRFRDITYSIYTYGYSGTEVGIRAQHLFPIGYTSQEWDYQVYPYSVAWIIRSDGTMVGLSYQKEQNNVQLLAWHWHTTGTPGQSNDSFESVACIPNATNGQTDTFFIVNRTINGQTVRCVEYMQYWTASNLSNAWFLDCAYQYNGTATNIVNGLTWLAGQSNVAALVNGVPYTGLTVSAGGVLTLPTNVNGTTILVGLPYQQEMMPMQFEWQGQQGTSQDKARQIRTIFVGLQNTAQGALFFAPSNIQDPNYPATYPWLQTPDLTWEDTNGQGYNSVTGLFTGNVEVPVEPGKIRDGTIYLTSNLPLPWTVLRIVARMEDSER